MERNIFLAVVSYAVFLFLHVQALDCNNGTLLKEVIEKCFSDRGIETDYDKIIPGNLTVVCRNKDKYKQALICIIGIFKQCLQSVGESISILPDDSSLGEGADYICQHVKALDDSCLHMADSEIKDCTEKKEQSQRNSNTDSQNIMCSSLQISYECAKEKLQVCSGETLQAVLTIKNEYFRPPACSPFDNSVNSVTSLPVVSCSSQSSIQQAEKECFTREGITYLPKVIRRNGDQLKQSVIESLTLNMDGLQKTCSDVSRYQRAVVCALQVSLQCLPAEYRDYAPAAENAKSMLKSLCDNVNVIDGECLNTVGARLFDCGYEQGPSYGNKGSLTDMLCYAYAASTECLSEVLPTCGCPMTKLYGETFKLYFNPPACSPITVKTPVCQPGTKKFMDSAATMLHGMSLLVLTALVVLGLDNTM